MHVLQCVILIACELSSATQQEIESAKHRASHFVIAMDIPLCGFGWRLLSLSKVTAVARNLD